MTGIFLSYNKRLIFGLLIFFGFGGIAMYSQTSLSGNLNQPHTNIVSISGPDRVIVGNVAGFAASDTILIIQMQGVKIVLSPYGNLWDILGVPGYHEFMIIQSVNNGTNEIIFRNNIINSYNLLGNIQVVRVPYYNSATVTGKLTCDPWDPVNGSGGVLALITGRMLKLNADIDVSGLGFTGGKDTIGDGICLLDNQPLFGQEYYPWSFTDAGYKGEGVANFTETSQPLVPNYTKGLGPNWNGGGGGNGRYSGGGGGANGGKGGTGGLEDQSICGAPWVGGTGGYVAKYNPNLMDRIFFGGGGGASTTSPTGSSSQGGNGGGIVIIVADTIMGNGGNIIANGEKGGSDTGLGGSGGGGAGGSIALYVKSYGSSPVKFSAQGGNGGDNPGTFGEGGGGGGGLLFISTALTGNVTDSLEGGKAGNYPASTASDGIIGEKRLNFMAVLNGFLYNSIRSSVTGDQVDSICSNVLPPKITGTVPVGGTPPYTFKWEKSNDAAFTTPNDLNNNSTDYTPTVVESATVWFRRIITDSSLPTALKDTSKAVQIIVQPEILNNLIVADPDTICFGSDPKIIKQGIPDLVLPSTYLRYIWQDSTVGGVWGAQLAAETVKEYDPNPSGGLTIDTWYRRIVISGRCKDKTAIAKFKVLDKITNNAFSQLFDTICFGGNTNLNTIAGLIGGLSTDYRYKWEQSSTGNTGTWTAIPGETNSVFDPDASVSLPVGDHFYRRIVFSGEQDACKDTTPKAARKVWPVITNNVIQADQTIGYDSIPSKLVQTVVPAGGAGISTYKYSWVKDTLGLPSAPGPNPSNQSDYQPPNLKWTVSFRRIINSSACTNTSNPVMIKVDSLIINVISLGNSALDTIYTGQVSSQVNGAIPTGGSAVASDGYAFKWYKSTAAVPTKNDWTVVTGSMTQFDPGVLTQSTWFRRDVSSPAVNPRATTQSNYIRVTVLPRIVNVNISANQAVCSGSRPQRLNGNAALSGGDGKYRFTWQDSTSGHDWQDIVSFVKVDSANYKPPALTFDAGYRRIVYSGKNDCGVEVSNIVKITVNPLPGTPDAGPDQSISSIGLTAKMNATPPLIGETGMWEVLEPNSATADNISEYNTMVRNLSLGANYFLWTVTTDIGNCKLSDSMRIILSKDFEPSAFSPNGDGINDQFVIEGLNLTEPNSAELTVVNSSGTEVFSTSNFNGETWTDWNGKNSKGVDLPEGTYYYMLKVITKDPVDNKNRVDKRKGFIILKRR
jgi:gliding motility-associated-like protein